MIGEPKGKLNECKKLCSYMDEIKYEKKKSKTMWNVPATRASFGHRLNQSMVQPDISAGNFRARLRNFSPTGEKHRTTWRLCWTRDMKYSYRFSFVSGRLGNSRFITGTRSLRISSISSRANKFDTWGEKHKSRPTEKKPHTAVTLYYLSLSVSITCFQFINLLNSQVGLD